MNRKFFLQKLAETSSQEDVSTFSSVMRELNKEKDLVKRDKFIKAFKEAFDEAFNQGLEDHQSIALIKAKQEIDAK